MPEESNLVVGSRERHRVLDLDASVRKDVVQVGTTLAEYLADEQPAVAFIRLSAAAHDGEAMVAGAGEKPLDRRLECRLRRHFAVESVPTSVILVLPLRAPAERRTEE